jgi:hypothetical protein
MGSVPTEAFSVSNLVQSLTVAGSPQLAATLSSPAVQAALQNAPTSDLVDLSSQALKLQETGQLFGSQSTAETATLASILYPLASLLAAANSTARTAAASGASGTSPAAASSTVSLANQLQSDLQAQEVQSLFGIALTASPPSSLFDTLG